jgi:hypothetical protein
LLIAYLSGELTKKRKNKQLVEGLKSVRALPWNNKHEIKIGGKRPVEIGSTCFQECFSVQLKMGHSQN